MFVSGYMFGMYLNKEDRGSKIVLFSGGYFEKLNKLKKIFLIIFSINIIYTLSSIATFGSAEFFSGAQLVNTISNYGSANTKGALDQIINFALGSIMLAVLAVILERAIVRLYQNRLTEQSYSTYVNQEMKNTIIVLPIALFILLPIFQFSRGAFVFGALTYSAISFWSGVGKSKKLISFLAVSAILVFIIIGQSRGRILGDESNAVEQLKSEISPWIAYCEIKENMKYLDYQHGNTLFFPLIAHIIPRGIWPDKPQNTSGYYNTEIHPEAASAGLMLAPTLFGVLYLNFGIVGVFLGVGLLGIFSGPIDAIVIYKKYHKIGLFVIVFSSYISLLRNDPSVVLFNVIVIFILYTMFRKQVKII
jgi:hypothetical protein